MGYKSQVEYGQLLLTDPTGLHNDGTIAFSLNVDDPIIVFSQKLIFDSAYANPTGL